MPKSGSLTLIAPRIAPALAQAMAEAASGWPQLVRLAGRGSISRVDPTHAGALRPWQRALLEALDLGDAIEQYPSAAVTRSGDVDERAGGFWMHAEPMHFSAGLDHLAATTLQGAGRMTPGERAQLEPMLAAHLHGSDLELCAATSGEWLVRSDRALDVRTASPDAAVAQSLDAAMPQGRDAAQLRRLMTELQMLLHEHPVNVRRVRRGLPEVNAVWFWGEGSLLQASRRPLPESFGDESYLRGVCRLNDRPVVSAADAAAVLARHTSAAVVVTDAADLDTLETRWIAPLSRALGAGVIAHLQLVLDRWRITIHRGALLRFWRKDRPPADWPRAQWTAC